MSYLTIRPLFDQTTVIYIYGPFSMIDEGAIPAPPPPPASPRVPLYRF